MPQPPQFAASVLVSVSQPSPVGEAPSPLQSASGAAQSETPHFPSMHVGVPPAAGQALSQLPQWSTFALRSVSQPSARPFTQSAWPALQLMPQVAALHVALPPFALHCVVHAPHVSGFDKSASQPFLGLPSQSAKPAAHLLIAHSWCWQLAVALVSAHAEPHAPQLSSVLRSVSQPSLGSPLQSAKPEAQIGWHSPATQRVVP